MTCMSLRNVYLCQILFSFQDVYEFPKVRMTSSNIGLKATMPTFHGIVGLRKSLEGLFIHVLNCNRK